MIPTGHDSLNTRSTLEVGGKSYAYYSLPKAALALGDVSRLPVRARPDPRQRDHSAVVREAQRLAVGPLS